MRQVYSCAFSCLPCLLLCLALAGCGAKTVPANAAAEETVAAEQPSRIEHGRYLVENVGMCGDCHTPMGPEGPMMDRHLMGGQLPFAPKVEIPDFVSVAPPIATGPGGYPGWTREQLVHYLQTGENANGTHSRPPMPHFRFNKQDAEAVADYLASRAPKFE